MHVVVEAENALGNLTKILINMDNWIEANRVNFTDDELHDLDRAKRNRVIVLFSAFALGIWGSRRFLKIPAIREYIAEG